MPEAGIAGIPKESKGALLMANDALRRILNTGGLSSRNIAQFGKFLAVGVINTVFGYLIFVLLTLLGFDPLMALLLTYLIGVPVNYFTTGKLVFDGSSFRSWLLFALSYVAIYGVNFGALTLLMQCGVSQLVAQAIAVPFIAILSFLIFKNIVFRK